MKNWNIDGKTPGAGERGIKNGERPQYAPCQGKPVRKSIPLYVLLYIYTCMHTDSQTHKHLCLIRLWRLQSMIFQSLYYVFLLSLQVSAIILKASSYYRNIPKLKFLHTHTYSHLQKLWHHQYGAHLFGVWISSS